MHDDFMRGERSIDVKLVCTECGKRAEGNHSWVDGSGEICDKCVAADNGVAAVNMNNNVPNLDAMSSDELMEFWKTFHRPTRKQASWLVGGTGKGYTTAAMSLAAYAASKATAQMCRERDDITGAQIYEIICKDIYKRLPASVKW